MRGLPSYCSKCGITFAAPGILFGSGAMQFVDVAVECPNCGGDAPIADGTYTAPNGNVTLLDGPPLTRAIVEQLMAAVRTPGVTAHDVLTFQSVAQAVASGEMDADTAAAKVREIGESFAKLWEWIKPSTGHEWLMFVLTIIGLILGALPHLRGDNEENGAQSPDPAIEIHQFHGHIEQVVYAALKDEPPTGFSAESRPPRPSQASPRLSQSRILVTGENRHARRKADALARKKKRT